MYRVLGTKGSVSKGIDINPKLKIEKPRINQKQDKNIKEARRTDRQTKHCTCSPENHISIFYVMDPTEQTPINRLVKCTYMRLVRWVTRGGLRLGAKYKANHYALECVNEYNVIVNEQLKALNILIDEVESEIYAATKVLSHYT